MVRVIEIENKVKFDKDAILGYYAEDKDYDTLITQDADIYFQGKKIAAFRKKAFKEFTPHTSETWNFWKKAAKSQMNDARGLAAGRFLSDREGHRTTAGQLNFFKTANKVALTEEEARGIIEAGKDPSPFLYRWTYTKKDRIVDTYRIEEIIAKMKKKPFKQGTPEGDKLYTERMELELQWFENWFTQSYLPLSDEDKPTESKRAFFRYLENQTRGNRCHSNVLGAFDRTPRIPYARLSRFTIDNRAEYASEVNKRTYKHASETLRETLPEIFEVMNNHFGNIRHPEFNLFGTCFTTITVNFNYRTAYHFDGNNFDGGVGVLTALTQGEYDGHYLVFPEYRIAFDIRDGDFIAADTQSMIHGNTQMVKKTPDAERISLVFYGRERLAYVDNEDCENCRRDFVEFSKKNLSQRCDKEGSRSWSGIYPLMWQSEEWVTYKDEHCPEASATNYRGTKSE